MTKGNTDSRFRRQSGRTFARIAPSDTFRKNGRIFEEFKNSIIPQNTVLSLVGRSRRTSLQVTQVKSVVSTSLNFEKDSKIFPTTDELDP